MKKYFILLFLVLLSCLSGNAQINRESRLQINDNPLVKIDSTGKPNETLPKLFTAFLQMNDFTGIVSGKLSLASDTLQTAVVLEVPFKVVYENNEIRIVNGFFSENVMQIPDEILINHPNEFKYMLRLSFEMTKEINTRWQSACLYLYDKEGNIIKVTTLKR